MTLGLTQPLTEMSTRNISYDGSAIEAAGNQNVCKTRGCNYSFWVLDDGRCVARNMLSN